MIVIGIRSMIFNGICYINATVWKIKVIYLLLPTSVCASHRKRSWSIRLPCLGYHLFFTIGYAPSGCPWAFLIAQCSSSIAKRLEIVRRFFIFVIYFFGFLSPFSLFAKFKSGGHNSLSGIGLQLASWQLVPGAPNMPPGRRCFSCRVGLYRYYTR